LVFEILALSLLLVGLSLQKFLLDTLMLLKELLNFSFVILEEISALAVKLRLDALELTGIALSHFIELALHFGYEIIDIFVHLLHGDHVVLVLGMECSLKFFFEVFLVVDNLLALYNLLVDL